MPNEEMSPIVRKLRRETGSEFLQVNMQIGDISIESDLLKELTGYDPDDDVSLQKEFIKQPVRYLKYSSAWVAAKDQLSEAEKRYARWRKEKWRVVQEKLRLKQKNDKSKKAPTKEDVEAEIEYRYSEEIDKFERKIRRWKKNADLFEEIKNAFKQKKDVLIVQGYLIKSLIDNEHLEIKKRKSF